LMVDLPAPSTTWCTAEVERNGGATL
jgi:hypothetical protein